MFRILDFTMLPDLLTDPSWLAVFLAVLALAPQVVALGQWTWKRWRGRSENRLQSTKDRKNYTRLLEQYRDYLDILENLIILRAQIEAGKDPLALEIEQQFIQTRDRIYSSLETRGDREEDMGTFQKLDVLEGRMIGMSEERRKRTELEARQAEIEAHQLFVKRPRPRTGAGIGAGQRQGEQNGA